MLMAAISSIHLLPDGPLVACLSWRGANRDCSRSLAYVDRSRQYGHAWLRAPAASCRRAHDQSENESSTVRHGGVYVPLQKGRSQAAFIRTAQFFCSSERGDARSDFQAVRDKVATVWRDVIRSIEAAWALAVLPRDRHTVSDQIKRMRP